jgi:ribose-phosphate pyrophosphokinase
MKIFSGSSNKPLVKKICKSLHESYGDIYLHSFPSGEKFCQIGENSRGEDVYIIQSMNSHLTPAGNPTDNLRVDELIFQMNMMIHTAKLAAADRVTAVVPYMAYLRQDRKVSSRTPITARLLADQIAGAGADRVIGLDFHCLQAQGFFSIPVDHLVTTPVLSHHIDVDEIDAVVSPDVGGLKRAEVYAKEMGKDLVFISKKRTGDETVKVNGVSGDVDGRRLLIVDDMTESAGTLIEAARVCHENGAIKITCAIAHGAFTPAGYDKLNGEHHIDELIATDSIDFDLRRFKKKSLVVKKVSVGNLLAQAIKATNENRSISQLFKTTGF